jgi:hypothetical protein
MLEKRKRDRDFDDLNLIFVQSTHSLIHMCTCAQAMCHTQKSKLRGTLKCKSMLTYTTDVENCSKRD